MFFCGLYPKTFLLSLSAIRVMFLGLQFCKNWRRPQYLRMVLIPLADMDTLTSPKSSICIFCLEMFCLKILGVLTLELLTLCPCILRIPVTRQPLSSRLAFKIASFLPLIFCLIIFYQSHAGSRFVCV